MHGIKIVPSNLANFWYIFPLIFTDISSCVGFGIGYKSIVKLNICAQPMHQIFVIKDCNLLKTSLSQ